MCILLLVLTMTVLLGVSSALSLPPPDTICGPNEMLSKCYNSCQLTCKNRARGYENYCTEDCSQTGCVCLPAHYRHDDGSCVLKEDCSPAQCHDDEVYDSCGTSRMDTCEERGNTCETKSLHCVEGCFCPEGFFRNTNGTCVPEAKCPPRTCNGLNEYFDECPLLGPDDDENCSAFLYNIRYPDNPDDRCCKPRCRCREGYYRNMEGICIAAKECANEIEEYARQWLTESSPE